MDQADRGGPVRRFGAAARLRLIRLVPKPIVRMIASPYIAGQTRSEAVSLARRLHEAAGLCSTIDVLGEDIMDPAEASGTLGEYTSILDDLGRCPFANISIKLSALGQGLDEALCESHLESLLRHARELDQFVRFDMEDHTTTDSTLRLYRRLVGRYPRIGIVLQARLHRTERDIRDLAPLRPNVRLCLGIYREPSSIGLQDKPAIKERLLDLLRAMWENGQYVALATHDEAVIRRALQMAERMGVAPSHYEVQMLLGVPRARIQRDLRNRGIKVRLYLPYGEHWYPYCLRRLENNPEMARMVAVNLLVGGWRKLVS